MSNNMDDQVDIPTISPLLNQPQRPEDIEVDFAFTGPTGIAFTGPIGITFLGIAFTGPTSINLRCSNKTWVLLVMAMLAFILVFIWMLSKNPSTA